MRLSKEERNTVVSFCCLLLAIFLFSSVFLIPTRGSILQSARLMPYIVTVAMLLLSGVFFIRSVIKALPGPQKLWASFKMAVTSKEWINNFLSIAIVALYIFLGIPYLGYYLSSALLILFILLFYVRRLKPIVSILSGLVLTGLIYLVFSVVFKIPLR